MHYSNLWRILALAAAALLLVAVQEAGAQESAAGKGSISTNVAGYANLLTLNALRASVQEVDCECRIEI